MHKLEMDNNFFIAKFNIFYCVFNTYLQDLAGCANPHAPEQFNTRLARMQVGILLLNLIWTVSLRALNP